MLMGFKTVLKRHYFKKHMYVFQIVDNPYSLRNETKLKSWKYGELDVR